MKKNMIETVESTIASEAPTTRREFIKFSGFALSAVTMPFWLTACGGGGGGGGSPSTTPTTHTTPTTPTVSAPLRIAGESNYIMVVGDKTSQLATVTVLDDYTIVGIYGDVLGTMSSWRIFCPDRTVVTIRMNTAQKVYDFTMDGYVVAFRNYTSSTVQVTATAPDGTSETKVINLDTTSLLKELFTTTSLVTVDSPAPQRASSGLHKVVASSLFDIDKWFDTEIEGEARDMCVKEADAVIECFTLGVLSFTKIIAIKNKIIAIKTKVTSTLQSLKDKIVGGVDSVVHGSEGPFSSDSDIDYQWGQAYRERLDGGPLNNIFSDTTTRNDYMQNQYVYSDWSNVYSDWSNVYSDWSNVYSDWSNNVYSNWSNWSNRASCKIVGATGVSK